MNFNDIQAMAEVESRRLNHFFLGVEHLFIALLEIENGTLARLIEMAGLPPKFVLYQLRLDLGFSLNRRYWDGFRESPRYRAVSELGKNYALQTNDIERALIVAILDEGDSMPVRTLERLGADLMWIRESAAAWPQPTPQPKASAIIQGDFPLSSASRSILNSLFEGSERIRVDKELPDNSETSYHYLVTPEGSNSVVVKFSEPDAILAEYSRFHEIVSPITFGQPVLSRPTFSDADNLAALSYIFPSTGRLVDLGYFIKEHGLETVKSVLERSLYPTMQQQWWSASERYQTSVWREYECFLPPAYIGQHVPEGESDIRLRAIADWQADVPQGSTVTLDDFTVAAVSPRRGSLLLKSGHAYEAVNEANQILITGISKEKLADFYPLQKTGQITVRITDTRRSMMLAQLVGLAPEVNLGAEVIATPFGNLPNPVEFVLSWLPRDYVMSLSPIHGNLNMTSILVDDAQKAHIMDFAASRFGHTHLDTALLEIALADALLSSRLGNIADVYQLMTDLRDDEIEGVSFLRNLLFQDAPEDYWLALLFGGFRLMASTAVAMNSRRLGLAYLLLSLVNLKDRSVEPTNS